MMSSPAKRRKISNSTAVEVNDTNTDLDHQTKPTTPIRPSYLSPTKASIARAYPHLSPSRPRTTTRLPAQSTIDQSLASVAPRTEPRQPLQNRQPSSFQHPALFDDFVQPAIVPKLVKRFEGSTPARQRSPSDEPQLPPTPVQLGLQEAPERPKGLSSSSPRGSRSGSERNRTRLRETQSITSSPLKPKPRPLEQPPMHDQESEAEMIDDRRVVNAKLTDTSALEDLPSELQERRSTVRSLREQLHAIKASFSKLRRSINTNELRKQTLSDKSIEQAITAQLTQKQNPGTFEQKYDDSNEASKYLLLFTPGGLTLAYRTETKLIDDQPKLLHHVTITAPPPWAPHIFSAAFDVLVDPDTRVVEHVIWTDTLPGRSQSIAITDELYEWLDKCMNSKLHGRNFTNLVWGIGQYFGKAVRRAAAFHVIEHKYGLRADAEHDAAECSGVMVTDDKKPLDPDQVAFLSRYLTKTQIIIDLPTSEPDERVRTRHAKKTEPKIMVKWNIQLTWNGVAKNACEIIPSGVPDHAAQSVQKLFTLSLPAQGFEKAFAGVYDLMKQQLVTGGGTGSSGYESREGSAVAGAKGKARKRKRFT